MKRALLALTLAARAASADAGEVPGQIALEVMQAPLPGQVPEAAPVRFALQDDGTVYVGGSSALEVGTLDSREMKDLDKLVSSVRKLPDLAGSVTLGPGQQRHRLVLRKGRPLDMTVIGDPAQAAPPLRPLAELITLLSSFSHEGLRPFKPASFGVSARQVHLPGGCREWKGHESVARYVFAPGVEDATMLPDWPSGVGPASVCAGNVFYSVTLRPLIPGEKP